MPSKTIPELEREVEALRVKVLLTFGQVTLSEMSSEEGGKLVEAEFAKYDRAHHALTMARVRAKLETVKPIEEYFTGERGMLFLDAEAALATLDQPEGA